jgi:LacI family transcriptional regulator
VKRKVTIRDVAELVGVHHSTVSRALSPSKRDKISPAVVKKVEQAADKLGYFPNIVASSLKQNRSFTVGVLIPDLTNSLFPPIIRGIQDTVEAAGYTVITANTDDEQDKELNALRIMRGRAIEGMIITTARREDRIVDECIANDIPFVLVNRTVDQDGVSAVVVDDDHGVRSVIDHLVGLGHVRIGHVSGPQHSSTGFGRARAFAQCMNAHDLQGDLIEEAEKYTIEEGSRAFARLLARDKKLTAVVAANDLLALGCMDAMNELGLLVPDNISITGYDNIQFLDRMSPALTTVQVPKYEMGAQATQKLLDMIAGDDPSASIVRMQPRLIVRNSTAAASP